MKRLFAMTLAATLLTVLAGCALFPAILASRVFATAVERLASGLTLSMGLFPLPP